MKWLFGILGFIIRGPIGGIVGFIIGAIIDAMNSSKRSTQQSQYQQPYSNTGTQHNALVQNILILTATVMKVDGAATKAELEYVKRFFVNNFNVQVAQEAILQLRNILRQTPPHHVAAAQIRSIIDYSSRLHILQYFFGIAAADGYVTDKEEFIIGQIAGIMGISSADYESIKAAFCGKGSTIEQSESAYVTLGLDKNASDNDLKTAYRNLAKKYHPDKFEHLGGEEQQTAGKKFREINEAYEIIRTERGL